MKGVAVIIKKLCLILMSLSLLYLTLFYSSSSVFAEDAPIVKSEEEEQEEEEEEEEEEPQPISFKISNGLAKIHPFGMRLTKGSVINTEIRTPLDSILVSDLKEFICSNESLFNEEQLEQIKASLEYEEDTHGATLLCKIFEVLLENNFTDTLEQEVIVEAEEDKKIVEAFHTLNPTTHSINANINIQGTSFIPVEVFCFIRLTKIEFENGKILRIIDTANPKISQTDGSTYGVEMLEETTITIGPQRKF